MEQKIENLEINPNKHNCHIMFGTLIKNTLKNPVQPMVQKTGALSEEDEICSHNISLCSKKKSTQKDQ